MIQPNMRANDCEKAHIAPVNFDRLVAASYNRSHANGYWDMAASLVTTGAIDGDAFRAAHSEIFATFSKIQPFLGELRKASGEADICKHMEAVVMAAPDAETILTRRREAMRAAAKMRAANSQEAEG